MKKDKILLIGGGGHCRAVIDVIELEGKYDIVGIIDKKELIGSNVIGYKIIGSDDDLKELHSIYKNAIVTIGQIKSNGLRIKLFNILKSIGYKIPIIKSPLSYISKHSYIDEGTVIMHQALINANVKIGKNCIINTKAQIEHDVIIGNNCHISTSSVINGGVSIGNNTMVGTNATLLQYVSITDKVIIGASALVNKDISESGVYVGVPAKKII